jgi:hypothetical protein
MIVLTILFVFSEGTRNFGFMNINSGPFSKPRVSCKALVLQTAAFIRNVACWIDDGLLYDKSSAIQTPRTNTGDQDGFGNRNFSLRINMS